MNDEPINLSKFVEIKEDVEFMTEKHRKDYLNRMAGKSVGNKKESARKGEKKIPRSLFIKLMLAAMAGAAAALAGQKVIQSGSRALNLNNAIKYMNDVKFKEYFERLGLEYSTEDFLMWSKVNIPSDNLAIMQNLIDFLIEDGFTETEAWYAISASFGNDGLSLVANLYGKDNIEDFLVSNGYFHKREDGTKKESAVSLGNYCEDGYANNVYNLMERQENEEKGKGL